MKVKYLYNPHQSTLEVDFSCELPVFPQKVTRGPFPRVRPVNRQSDLQELARLMAQCNRGRFRVELAHPQRAFWEFLRDLMTLPGVDSLVAARRYGLEFVIGRAFEPREVAARIARCVQRYFYPEEPIRLAPVKELPQQEARGLIFLN